jgi:hypothetical protein
MLKEHARTQRWGERRAHRPVLGRRGAVGGLRRLVASEPRGAFWACVRSETMAIKRPIVAITTGGTPEVLDHSKCGSLTALVRSEPAVQVAQARRGCTSPVFTS